MDRTGSDETRRRSEKADQQTGPRVVPPHSPRYDVRKKQIDPLDRRLSPDDEIWLRASIDSGQPPTPRFPLQTTYGEPPRSHGRSNYEPTPIHPFWVVVGMILWASLWLCLYVGSAYWLRH
jgi:hypothetical protein